MKPFFITLVFSVAAFAGITDHQYYISGSKESNSILITPKKGFHLNQEGPASVVIDSNEAMQKPTVKKEKGFAFNLPAGAKQAVLSFYVCDDKKTVCEKHEDTVDLTKLSKATATASDITQPTDEKKANVKTSESQPHYDDIKNVSLKSTNGKPTIIVFSAPWCPPCVRMNTEVYNQKPVQKQLAKINFYKLNSDLPENYDLFKSFKIKAIPTLVLLDQNGNESFRWLDYQPARGFAASLNTEIKKVSEAATLLANAQVGDKKAAHILGMRAYMSYEFAEAIKWLSITKNEEDQKFKLASEVALAQ
ncbi:MAG: thioredoxin family protein, partial [Bdellovibrionaceae bacterium]|nr:thioredoxin family protein [Pseudobdellovibrionaceae bacterium]